MFTGTIERVERRANRLLLTCFGGFGNLQESEIAGFAGKIGNLEMVYTILSTTGIPDERIYIDGLDAVKSKGSELFEVVVAIDGMTVPTRTQVNDVWFLPASVELHLTDGLRLAHASEVFSNADCFALVIVEDELVLGAERRGLQEIDIAIAWIATQSHDARLTTTGNPREFRRTDLLSYPQRSTIVAVRGLLTGRRWLRETAIRGVRSKLKFAPQGMPPLPPLIRGTLARSDEQALLAWYRAKGSGDQIAAVLALWDAIEFYCARTTVEPSFAADELKVLKKAVKSVRKEISPKLMERANDLLGKVTDPPLLTRLRAAIAADAVPIGEPDIWLLVELRKLRNDAVHGRGPGHIPEENVRRGLSIVARMLVERVRRSTSGP